MILRSFFYYTTITYAALEIDLAPYLSYWQTHAMMKTILQKFLTALCIGALPAMMVCGVSYAQKSTAEGLWEGDWFTCEFAQRQRAPDEGCQMFDDEGFRFSNGKIYYLRMKGSQETACRGEKKGQCFKRNIPAIKAALEDNSYLRVEGDKMILRYFGCDQSYSMKNGPDFATIIPDGKSCIWSQKRHFYIARYHGDVTIIK